MNSSKTSVWATFHADDEGTALTEFVITLPIIILLFSGIVTLGQLGMAATRVKARAQSDMWRKVVDPRPIDDHVSPRLAAFKGARYFSDGEYLAGLDSATTFAGGHWGESYVRVKPLALEPAARQTTPGNVPGLARAPAIGEVTQDPERKIGDSPFAATLVKDNLDRDVLPQNKDINSILTSVTVGSGIVPYLGAGIRYGTEFGEATDTVKGYGLQARYIVAVAPKPTSEFQSWGVARLSAELQPNYRNLMRWGKSELDDISLNVP